MEVHCIYRADGRPCTNEPTDARLQALNSADQLELVFCTQHAQAYDAIEWARRKGANP